MNRAMPELTGVSYSTGEENKDMAKSRQARNMKDTRTLLLALAERNPFTTHTDLINIMTGVHAESSVNVEKAREVGQSILDSMTGKAAAEYSFTKSNEAITFSAKSSIKVDGEKIQVDPQLLFQRLIIARQSLDDMSAIFKCELCSYPPSDMNCQYVTGKYGATVVIFDSYKQSSTKDMTHQRRTGGKTATSVTFSDYMKLTMKKDHFLSNSSNKQSFINMLSRYLQKVGCQTHHSQADADLLIVQTAVESARRANTVLVGDDTDLLILLCYYTEMSAEELFFQPEPRVNSTKRRVWNMKALKEKLGQDVCNNIFFIHAILGCDTTPRLHGIGKGTSLKKFCESHHFRNQAKVFNNTSASKKEVIEVGEKALVCLYNGKSGETLDCLRYRRYCQVQPQNLPPTSAAATYHSLRVYFQVQQWKGVDATMSTEEWGWKSCEGLLVPVITHLPPAPEALLHVIGCNCFTDCSSLRCSCRKNNRECSPACGQCKGSACTNSAQPDESERSSEDNDDS